MNSLRAATTLLLALALPAQAELPGPTGGLGDGYTGTTVSVLPASMSFACGSVSLAGVTSAAITVSGGGCEPFHPLQGILLYYFRINGPDTLQVPVVATSLTTLVADGAAQAGSSVTMAGQGLVGGNCFGDGSGQCGSFQSVVTFNLTSNQAYLVAMQATVSNFLGAGSGYAFVDPVFAFAPSFLFAGDYTIELSPGIGNGGNVSPVPEPGVVSLMALGLGVLGLIGRRRARAAARA